MRRRRPRRDKAKFRLLGLRKGRVNGTAPDSPLPPGVGLYFGLWDSRDRPAQRVVGHQSLSSEPPGRRLDSPSVTMALHSHPCPGYTPRSNLGIAGDKGGTVSADDLEHREQAERGVEVVFSQEAPIAPGASRVRQAESGPQFRRCGAAARRSSRRRLLLPGPRPRVRLR
jgi:hypothetical protein